MRKQLSIKNYHLLTQKIESNECLYTPDYFIKRIGGSESTFFFHETSKTKIWKEFLNFLVVLSGEKKVSSIVKQHSSKSDQEIMVELQDYFEKIDYAEFTFHRKKSIIELIKTYINIDGLKILVFSEHQDAERLKTLGDITIWHRDLPKNYYDVIIYDHEIHHMGPENLNIPSYMKKEKYYIYIATPNAESVAILYALKALNCLQSTLLGFPEYAHTNMMSYTYYRDRIIGKFMNIYKTPHLCNILYEKKHGFHEYDVFARCKYNKEYILL